MISEEAVFSRVCTYTGYCRTSYVFENQFGCIQKSAQLSFGDDKSILWNVLKKKHMVLRVIITEKDWQEKNGWLAVLNQAIIGVIF